MPEYGKDGQNINYQDANGNKLADSQTFYGNVGDKPVVAYTYIDGYTPEYRNLTKTFQIYMNNMKSLFMEMIRNADLVIFNRCQDEHPLANFRRSVKVVNSRAEVVFENEEGEIDDIFPG